MIAILFPSDCGNPWSIAPIGNAADNHEAMQQEQGQTPAEEQKKEHIAALSAARKLYAAGMIFTLMGTCLPPVFEHPLLLACGLLAFAAAFFKARVQCPRCCIILPAHPAQVRILRAAYYCPSCGEAWAEKPGAPPTVPHPQASSCAEDSAMTVRGMLNSGLRTRNLIFAAGLGFLLLAAALHAATGRKTGFIAAAALLLFSVFFPHRSSCPFCGARTAPDATGWYSKRSRFCTACGADWDKSSHPGTAVEDQASQPQPGPD